MLQAPGGLGFGRPWPRSRHCGGNNKSNAVTLLREELGAQRVRVFGDISNDLSICATADKAYAPGNVQAAATQMIGHQDEDAIARSYLRIAREMRVE